jgi:hypothetical protein
VICGSGMLDAATMRVYNFPTPVLCQVSPFRPRRSFAVKNSAFAFSPSLPIHRRAFYLRIPLFFLKREDKSWDLEIIAHVFISLWVHSKCRHDNKTIQNAEDNSPIRCLHFIS